MLNFPAPGLPPSLIPHWTYYFFWDKDTGISLAQFMLEAEDEQVSSLPTSGNLPGCLWTLVTLQSEVFDLPALISIVYC